MTRVPFAVALALAAGALAVLPDRAPGCATVPPRDERVETSDEGALIVWDEATRTEHFVRRASFRSTGYDFGFLVPTPNRPDLDVANDSLFGELAALTAAKVEYREKVREVPADFWPGCAAKTASRAEPASDLAAGKADAPGGVEVLEQKRVGDYDATVLIFRKGAGDTAATGAAALELWLAKHGYETPPAVRAWLARYVADQWCITAFKIAAPDAKNAPKLAPNPARTARRDLRARPIRMSFKTDRPFYPYREPEQEPTAQPIKDGRLLRVFVAAKGRVGGALGDGAKPWPGRTVWAGALDSPRAESLFTLGKLNAPVEVDGVRVIEPPKPVAGWWLTEFEDTSSPRPGTDEVFFAPAADQTAVARPTVYVDRTRIVTVTPWWHIAVYIGLPVVLVLGGLGAWRALRR
jgi:hypothetical protein